MKIAWYARKRNSSFFAADRTSFRAYQTGVSATFTSADKAYLIPLVRPVGQIKRMTFTCIYYNGFIGGQVSASSRYSIIGVRYRMISPFLGITVRHHKADLVMPKLAFERIFLSAPHAHEISTFALTPHVVPTAHKFYSGRKGVKRLCDKFV